MDKQHARLSELDNQILHIQNDLLLLPKSHRLRAYNIRAIADLRFRRYQLSGQQDDLERSIVGHTEAIFFPHPLPGPSLSFDLTFENLAGILGFRAHKDKQPEDVKCCVMFFRYLQDQSPASLDDTTTLLVNALSVKVELGLGDVRGDVEEIADLCYKLLNSDNSTSSHEVVSPALIRVVHSRWFENGSTLEERKIIQYLCEANMHIPAMHKASLAVADSLLRRLDGTNLTDHYEEGIAICDKIIAFRAPGDRPSPYQTDALGLASSFAASRFDTSGRPDHLEEAIYRTRNVLDVTPPDDPARLSFGRQLLDFQDRRGLGFQDVHSSNLKHPSHPSFQDLTKSLAQSKMGTFSEDDYRNALFRISHDTDKSEIEDAVRYCRQLLVAPLAGQLGRIPQMARYKSAHTLIYAFDYTKKIEYLNEAISVIRSLPQNPHTRRLKLQDLIFCQTIRLAVLQHAEDLVDLMELFPVAVDDISSPIPQRFEFSCQWACLARDSRHPSAPTAYDHAILLMQATLAFSPTLHSQHFRLVAMSNGLKNLYETLPMDYASFLIGRGQLEKAIETLERGRALMWSEMRGFRTSIDKIRTADSDLADKFAAVNRELEKLTLTSGNDTDGRDSGIKRRDPYGDLVVRKQRLLDDREKLISHLQSMPGLENFLKPLSFDDLRSAALHGPVIVINHCHWRCDIVILLHDSPPSLIPTSDDFYSRANKLRDQLLDTRRKGLDSNEYEKALNSVLNDLYELVGRPVIKKLNELNVPEQSRVWWCPTSALCSLPLHAMGPIPSDMGRPQYFLDLYIPSYTPTLSALIESNRRGTETPGKPSILLALQPDEFMPQALPEMQVVQGVETQVTTLISAKATPSAVLERLRDHRFAHIVCHGMLEAGKPFEASFKLYSGARLSLLNIVEAQLPDAEFAFLSACHTAELTEDSIADEGLHLAVAMQYCGFRSVVGTMWAMADTDGRDIAGNFYKSVFSDKMQGIRHYERTAEGLRDSVRKLRRKRGITLERWVNFVHYGA